MKDKIFAKLKQDYSHLGLGNEILKAHASALAAMGFVADENLDAVVAAQKEFLENVQKANDQRASSAAAKAREDAQKEHEAAAKRKAEEEAKKAEDARKAEESRKAEEARKAAENEMPEWYKKVLEAQRIERDEAAKKAAEERTKFDELIASLKKENEETRKSLAAAEAAKAKEVRAQFILDTAKRLNIPQYRIDEGFVIDEKADNATIEAYLNKVSTNLKTQQLPTGNAGYPLSDGKPDQSEVDAIAADLINITK